MCCYENTPDDFLFHHAEFLDQLKERGSSKPETASTVDSLEVSWDLGEAPG